MENLTAKAQIISIIKTGTKLGSELTFLEIKLIEETWKYGQHCTQCQNKRYDFKKMFTCASASKAISHRMSLGQ